MTPCIDNYRDLPLGVYLDILDANSDESRDEVEKQAATLALLSGMTEKAVLDLPIADYTALVRKASFIYHPMPRIPRAARSYKAGAFTLRAQTDLRKITAAQYIDFKTFAPEGDARLVELLSVILIPDGCSYNDGYDIAEVQDAIRENISVEQAVSLAAFFLTRFAALIRSTRTSLSRLEKRERNPERKARVKEQMARLTAETEALLTGLGAGSPA